MWAVKKQVSTHQWKVFIHNEYFLIFSGGKQSFFITYFKFTSGQKITVAIYTDTHLTTPPKRNNSLFPTRDGKMRINLAPLKSQPKTTLAMFQPITFSAFLRYPFFLHWLNFRLFYLVHENW